MNIYIRPSEEAYDSQIYDEALAKHLENPISYTHDELINMLEKDD